MALLIFYLLLTMGISFLCSLLESVLMSTPISYITMKQDDGDRNAALFLRMKQDPDRPLSAILSLNTIANTLGAAAVGHQATLLSGEHWFGIISAAMTLLILVFSEIVPKSIGTSHWKDLLWLSKIMQLLVYLLYPIVWIIEKLHNSISDEEPDTAISREEVSAMANIGEEEGVLDNSENKVIQNIIKLDDIKAYEVMTPRIVANIASENITVRQFYKQQELSHNSRIPVYSDSPEFITGYVMRNKDQIALIIDDYGCFQGIITLEDIIETILGMEIIDENDTVTDMQQYAKDRWLKRQKQYKQIVLPEDDDE